MPPTEEMIRKAIECLGNTHLVNFSADKTSVIAGDTVTISWDVDIPSTCGLSVRLNHTQVPRKGSKTVVAAGNLFFRLDCGAAGVNKLLGTVEVAADASSCMQREIPEDIVADQVRQSVDRSLADFNARPENENKQATKRTETGVEVEPGAIVLRLRLKVQVENFFDPNVDVDAKIAVGISPEGNVIAFYRSFAVDVDWPWWVTGITLGISKIVEEFADGTVEAQMKNKILNDLRDAFQARLTALGGRAVDMEAIQDAILVTICNPDGRSVIGHIAQPIGRELVLGPV